MRAKTTIQDPPDAPPSGENSLERGSFPAPGEDAEGGGAHPARTMPTPSSSIAGAKGVMGGGRGSSGQYDGCMSGGDTTVHRGCVGD